MSILWRSVLLLLTLVVGTVPVFAQQTIQAKDTLRVICAEEPGLNKNYDVTDDGLILVNFLGAVKVSGLTEAQAAAQIKKQLEDERILPKATITVSIVQASIPMVKFEGAVGLEAETPWKAEMRLSDVVRLAEPNAKTDLTKVTILSLDGKTATVDFSIADLETNVNNPLLKAGDIVRFAAKAQTTPPTNPPTDPPTNPPTNPPAQNQVKISGEVVLSGAFPFADGMTVQDALVRAGGFTAVADSAQVVLKRGGANRFVKLPDEASLKLMPGDEVSVLKKSENTDPNPPTDPPVKEPEYEPLPPDAHVVFVGAVKTPGKVMLKPGMKLSEAIELAGGFIDGARTDRIRILSPNNTKPRTVNFRDIELRYKGDILLKPGQTIEIPGAGGIPVVGLTADLAVTATVASVLVSL